MQRRVFGTECEYALFYSVKHGETRALSEFSGVTDSRGAAGLSFSTLLHPSTMLPEEVLAQQVQVPKLYWDDESLLERLKRVTSYLVASLTKRGHPFAGEFLGNGGRFYIDRGAHPEYATPECATVRDVVAHEKAGDRIVRELVELAETFMAETGRPGSLRIFKNNVDSFGTTYGHHENYLVRPRVTENIEFLVPFLVTRQIFSGAGKVATRGTSDEGPYQLTQRADFIDRVFSDRTSQVRGIINLRKREIARQGHNRRLHVLVGDSNMSEYALGLKIGTTALVLRLLEEDDLDDLPLLSFPVQAIKNISQAFDCPVEVENRQGQHYNALDIQRIYLEKVHRFLETHESSPCEKEILSLWEGTLAGLRGLKISQGHCTLEEDPGNLRRRIDWLLKLWLINRAQHKSGFDWSDGRARVLDVGYHELDSGSGIFERCEALDLVDRMVDEQEVLKARTEPPPGTRAWTRGMIIQSTSGKNVELIIKNWEKVKIIGRSRSRSAGHPFGRHVRMINRLEIALDDPFMANDASAMEKVREFVQCWD